MQDATSDEDFLRMQQEAIMRVREMQKRARATLENNGLHIESDRDGDEVLREETDIKKLDNILEPEPTLNTNSNKSSSHSFMQSGMNKSSQQAKAQPSSPNSHPSMQNNSNHSQSVGKQPQHADMMHPNNNMKIMNTMDSTNSMNSMNQSHSMPTRHPSNPMSPPHQNNQNNNPHSNSNNNNNLPVHPAMSMNNSFLGSLSSSTQPLFNLLSGVGGDGSNPLAGLNFNFDKDQLILLATIYVIFKDGGDKWLMLALAYVLFT